MISVTDYALASDFSNLFMTVVNVKFRICNFYQVCLFLRHF